MLPCLIGVEGTVLSRAEVTVIQRLQPAGFVLFSRNIEALEQTRELTTHLRELVSHDPVIAIDQEGGRVIRTTALGIELPSAWTLRKHADASGIILLADLIAETLKYLGVNTDFAPVLDICHHEEWSNALPGRCWGMDREEVIKNASLFNDRLKRRGIMSCGKHFPGMGMAQCDPHKELPIIDGSIQDLMRGDMAPFLAMSPDLPSMMVAHVILQEIDPDVPASLSGKVVWDILRNQMKYDGVVFTDDLCMGAISDHYGIAEAAFMSLEAGCDLPLICHDSLHHLEEFSRLLPKVEDYEAKGRQKRMKSFMGKMTPPLEVSEDIWASLLNKTREMLVQYPEEGITDDFSPVNRY